MKKLFMDMEFTGLTQKTSLISLALISETGDSFYAEFSDYDVKQLDRWLIDNVINNLFFNLYDRLIHINVAECSFKMKGDTKRVVEELTKWLKEQGSVEIWGDCLAYDWVLFCELFGGALNLPPNVYYIPFDICTLFSVKNIDPDINRCFFIGTNSSNQHNALDDALVIKECFNKLTNRN